MTKIIGFDGSRAFGEVRTGTENYSYQLLKALASIDQKNSYIVYVRSDSVIPTNVGIQLKNSRSELDSRRSLPRAATRGGNDNYFWPKNFRLIEIPWSRFWTQGGLALQTFKDRLDVLFVPAHTLPVIRKPGLKTVVTVHDLGSQYLPSMHQLKQRLYLGFMQRYQLKTATRIIAVSKATKRDLVRRIGIDPEKIRVIYEGYDKEKFKACPERSRGTQNSKLKTNVLASPYFLFVGTVQPRKNLERLIKAFAKWSGSFDHKAPRARPDRSLRVGFAPDNSSVINSVVRETAPVALIGSNFAIPYLVIVGQRGWMSDEIYKLPKKLGIEERVKFLGYVPEKDLPALYQGAVALIFPSLFEGFGLPILEAQACGVPVVTSNVSSMPEVAGKGAVYVNPASIDDIVRGMREVGVIREKLIKAGFENVKRFSWEKCAAQTLEVFENL